MVTRRKASVSRCAIDVLIPFAALILVGCGGGGTPELRCRAARTWRVPADGAALPAPRAVAFAAGGEAYVLDTAGRVLSYSSRGEPTGHWRMPESDVGKPEGICVLQDGRVAVCDTHYHRVLFFDRQGTVLDRWGRFGRGDGEFIYPVAIAQDEQRCLYVAEYGSNDRVQKFSADGRFLLTFGSFGTGRAQLQRPSGVVWHERKVYVSDAINNRVQVFTDNGAFECTLSVTAAGGLRLPYDLAFADGELVLAEYGGGGIVRITLDGAMVGRFGSSGSRLGQFRTPWGVAVSPDGRIVVADTGNRRIVELRPE